MKRFSLVVIIVALCFSSIAAQDLFIQSEFYSANERKTLAEQLGFDSVTTEPTDDSPFLAVANPDYPITPGDVYTLTYYEPSASYNNSTLVNQLLQVDSNYNINVPFLGIIKVKGMTFIDFKTKVEEDFNNNYSYLRAQLKLTDCGSFEVYVYGEVKNAVNVKCWSMTRLSDLVKYATKYASSREIYITYADGKTYSYDLYSALKEGKRENNPFLQPGCKVRFNKADKLVLINGCVKEPGQYQIKNNETITDIINRYSKGFDFNAEESFVTVSSYADGKFNSNIVELNGAQEYSLSDMDSIFVSKLNESKPYVTVQGAVLNGKFKYEFFPGETIEQLLRNIKSNFLESSDTTGIYFERNGQKTPVDTDLAFTTAERGSMVVEQGDVIVVPYTKQYVTVSGGVSSPGNYKYEPDRDAQYYINLAGGFSTDAIENSLKVIDSNGHIVNKKANLLPNYSINIKKRNTNAANNIALGISIATFGIAIYNLVK